MIGFQFPNKPGLVSQARPAGSFTRFGHRTQTHISVKAVLLDECGVVAASAGLHGRDRLPASSTFSPASSSSGKVGCSGGRFSGMPCGHRPTG